MSDFLRLYLPLSPTQLAAVVQADWQQLPMLEQAIIAPKLQRSYADMLARQLEAACHGSGFVVSFCVPLAFLADYPLRSVAYREHEAFCIPAAELPLLNQVLQGKIRLVSAFTRADNSVWQHRLQRLSQMPSVEIATRV